MRVFLPGRWQPLHKGHKELIKKVLKEGHKVIIGIRDTKKNKNNPYSFKERKEMFLKEFPDIKVFKLPDFDCFAYGRKVGYKIRRVKLPREIEKISATEIRNNG